MNRIHSIRPLRITQYPRTKLNLPGLELITGKNNCSKNKVEPLTTIQIHMDSFSDRLIHLKRFRQPKPFDNLVNTSGQIQNYKHLFLISHKLYGPPCGGHKLININWTHRDEEVEWVIAYNNLIIEIILVLIAPLSLNILAPRCYFV